MSDSDVTGAMTDALDRVVDRFVGRVGYAITNLRTGEHLSRNETMEFPTASTVKMPILTALHAHLEEAGISWRETIPVDSVDIAPGSGILQYLSRDLRLSYRDVAWLMICLSDNTATNMILHAVGRERVAALIADRIDPEIRLRGTAGAAIETARYPSMGYATPGAMTRYLERLARYELPGAEQTIAIAEQQVFQSMIPRYLPLSPNADVPLTIAHKTGALRGVRVDIGIIRSAVTTLTVTVMTADSPNLTYDTIHEGELCIAAVTYAACHHWLGVTSAAGERALLDEVAP